MAYHNLNEKNIPLTSYPDVPIASPPPSPAVYSQPAMAQPAQPPMYAQQPGYAPQMYQPVYMPAQPAYPQSQPMYAQSSMQQQQQQYPAGYVPSYQPVYQPSPVAQAAPSAPSNYFDLKTSIRARDSHFGCGRYIKQAHHFSKHNWCKLAAVFVMWSLVGWGVNVAINAMAGRHHRHSDGAGSNDGEGLPWDYENRWPEGGDVIDACAQRQQQDELNCGGMGCFRTKCESDGTFASKQTLGSSCWCVDEAGVKFADTVQHCSLFTTDCALRRTQTECQVRRAADTLSCAGRLGCFKTQCEVDGSFVSKQQLPGAQNTCFCVDDKGVEMGGTRGDCTVDCFATKEQLASDMGVTSDRAALKQFAIWAFLHVIFSIFLWSPVIAGLFTAVFNAIKTSSPLRFRDFFSGFFGRYYCKLLRLSFVLRFAEAFLLLLVLPGIWWVLVTLFAVPLHKQHSFLGTCGSIRISMMVIHRHFCSMIGFLIVLWLLQVVGFLCLMVGLLYTMPLAFVAVCFCYHDLIGIEGEVPFAGSVNIPVAVQV